VGILVVSDRACKNRKTDFLVNALAKNYNADVIYTKQDNEKIYFLDRVLHKFHIELDKSSLNKRLVKALDSKKYNQVIILKGNRVYPWVLKKIKVDNPELKLVSWNGDNMYRWHNKTFFFHFGLNYYDVICTVNIPDYKNITKLRSGEVLFFDKRADFELHKPLNLERKQFEFDVLFIGSYERERYEMLLFLANNGIRLDIYGSMWDNCKGVIHENMCVHFKALVGNDYVLAVSNAKISLGFLRKINNDTQTSRTFEIPACGGFMLMERTQDHLRLFREGEEAEYFDSNEELLSKLMFYLENDEARELIAANGRKRVVDSKYFFDDLADEIMKGIVDVNL